MNITEHKQRVGERVRGLRWRRGLSQAELSEKAGVSHQVISLTEQGKRVPYPKTIRKLAEALDVSTERLTVGEE
jgi:transcriptional regulator with XRE-family HTH domain